SSVAGQLTYHWARSNGSQTTPHTVSVTAGQTVNVNDSVTAASDTYTGSDALDVTSPASMSQSIPITVTCTAAPPPPSHVSSITVSSVTMVDTTTCSVPDFMGSATVTVDVSSTTPVTLSWQTSQNPAGPTPGTPVLRTGSMTLSGQTSYTRSITFDFGPIQTC